MRRHRTIDRQLACALVLLSLAAGVRVSAEDGAQDVAAASAQAKDELLDAYIAGRLITAYALSEQLSPFIIGVVVQGGSVTLTGAVETGVLHDLAIEIARGVDEVDAVISEIRVDPEAPRRDHPGAKGFLRRFDDASITARVKTRLLWNGSTQGLAIDVEARDGVVILTGTVQSPAERELAGQIAMNTRGVRRVENRLTLDQPREQTLGQTH